MFLLVELMIRKSNAKESEHFLFLFLESRKIEINVVVGRNKMAQWIDQDINESEKSLDMHEYHEAVKMTNIAEIERPGLPA